MECQSIGVVISQLPGGRASVVRQKVDVLWRRGLGGMIRRFVISSRGRKNLRDGCGVYSKTKSFSKSRILVLLWQVRTMVGEASSVNATTSTVNSLPVGLDCIAYLSTTCSWS